jgi:hypothetical protein
LHTPSCGGSVDVSVVVDVVVVVFTTMTVVGGMV